MANNVNYDLQNAFLMDNSEELAKVMDNDESLDVQRTLCDAARWGNGNLMKYLVSKGGSFTANEQEAFHNVVQWLSDVHWHGAELDAKKTDTWNFVLSQGIDINGQDGKAIEYCAKHGGLVMLKQLVESGADLNAAQDRPIQQSVSNDQLDTTLYLLEKGASKEVAMRHATPDVESGIKRQEFFKKLQSITKKVANTFSSKSRTK